MFICLLAFLYAMIFISDLNPYFKTVRLWKFGNESFVNYYLTFGWLYFY